jgi:hypothetical protein
MRSRWVFVCHCFITNHNCRNHQKDIFTIQRKGCWKRIIYESGHKVTRCSFCFLQANRWSATEGENKQGHTQLHDLLAESYYQEKDYGKASKHFLRGGNPERFAQMITEWCKDVYPNEQDLLIARAVLQ